MESICILGRQPKLGIAELESIFGAAAVAPTTTPVACLVKKTPQAINLPSFGGIIKTAQVIDTLNTKAWQDIQAYLLHFIPELVVNYPEGKIKIGISCYGVSIHSDKIQKLSLAIKKTIKSSGRSVRIVPNTSATLSSAQVLHNGLTKTTGCEILIVSNEDQTIIAKTHSVQDITAYTARDQLRPKRDARVGMLPPKLAQIIINLARGENTASNQTVLDPFCGTGVLLQEALLMGYEAYGSDIEQRMIDFSNANLEWLGKQASQKLPDHWLELGDACTHTWQRPFNIVAAETYLGQPYAQEPSPQMLQKNMQTCHVIHKKFLKNLALQTKAGTRLCLAVPAWRTKSGIKHLETLEYLSELGYNRISFRYAQTAELIYFREDQHVARELVVLQRC